MNLGGCHGNNNNTGVQNSSKCVLFWILGTYELRMDGVDF